MDYLGSTNLCPTSGFNPESLDGTACWTQHGLRELRWLLPWIAARSLLREEEGMTQVPHVLQEA